MNNRNGAESATGSRTWNFLDVFMIAARRKNHISILFTFRRIKGFEEKYEKDGEERKKERWRRRGAREGDERLSHGEKSYL